MSIFPTDSEKLQSLKAEIARLKEACEMLREDRDTWKATYQEMKDDKIRIIDETVKWKRLACDRLNCEILPMRYKLDELRTEIERKDIDVDRAYADGLNAGWTYCVREDVLGFNSAKRHYRDNILKAKREIEKPEEDV